MSPTETRAITLLETALKDFEKATGLSPRVALVPPKVFTRYERERAVLDGILPSETLSESLPPNWTSVRLIEHERVEEIEVY